MYVSILRFPDSSKIGTRISKIESLFFGSSKMTNTIKIPKSLIILIIRRISCSPSLNNPRPSDTIKSNCEISLVELKFLLELVKSCIVDSSNSATFV